MAQEATQSVFKPNLIPHQPAHNGSSISDSFYSSPPPSPRLRSHLDQQKPIVQTSSLLLLPAEIRALILLAAFGHRTIHADLDPIHTPTEPSSPAQSLQRKQRRPNTPPLSAAGPATNNHGTRDMIPWRALAAARQQHSPPPVDFSSPFIRWKPCSHVCHRGCFSRHHRPRFVVDRDRCCCTGRGDACTTAAARSGGSGSDDAGLGSCRIGALGWLLSCRQAYAEGVETLYRHNTFRLNESFALENMSHLLPPSCSCFITQLSLSLTMGRSRLASDRMVYPRARDKVDHLPQLLALLPEALPELARLHLVVAGELWPEAQLIAYCAPSETLHGLVESVLALLEGAVRHMRMLRRCEVAFDSSVYFPWVQVEKNIVIDFKDYEDFEQCPYSIWRDLPESPEREQTDRHTLMGFWICLDAWDAIPWSVMTDLFGTGPW